MCELCKRSPCPPGCPNYAGSVSARCRECGLQIFPGDGSYIINGKRYCEECVESATLEDLVRLCETEQEEILGGLGIRHDFYDPGKE